MALTDESGMVMPVAPMYGGGNSGFGNMGCDWGWVVLLLLLAGNGWGNGFGGGGYGNMMLGYDFPWLLNGQNGINANTNAGFQNAMINDGITGIRGGISDLSTQLCNGFATTAATINSGFANAETAENARQMASMNQLFNLSSQFADCCCENRLGLANLNSTIISENCADRQALNEGVRDIIANQTAGTQRILDKLCDQELQAERRENANLRSELMYARGQASQIEQTAQILAGQTNEVDALYNRLSNCPVPTTPVYGRTPIFSCNQGSCGCGCNGGF